MKPVSYKKNDFFVIAKGNCNGFDYFILNLGRHPTAYVRVPLDHKYYGKSVNELINLEVHGGITWAGDDFNFNPIVLKDSWWIGWDYSHAGDYYASGYGVDEISGFKYTSEEILEDVMSLIKQLKEEL